jgi:hypothetical protein
MGVLHMRQLKDFIDVVKEYSFAKQSLVVLFREVKRANDKRVPSREM